MPDFAEITLPKLKSRKNAILPQSDDILLPSYDGFGLANLTTSITHWLGRTAEGNNLLDKAILEKFEKTYKRVVLILVDALGYHHLLKLIAEGKAEFWQKQLEQGLLFPLTSVTPSTTATALTTIWTSAHPNEHGIIGYEMWVKELSMVINTILHMPTTFSGDVGGLSRAGFDPNKFLGITPFGADLSASKIESHAFLPSSIGNSGLSQMHLRRTSFHGYTAESDLWVNMRDLLNGRPNNRKFVYAYWSHVDSLMHRYGTYDERVTEQFSEFSFGLEHILLNGLESWAKKDSLFLVTADHGSIPTPYYAEYDLNRHPKLQEMLVMQPTCEGRLPFLYLKPGAEAEVRSYFEKTWPGKFTLITRDEALSINLFGKGRDHADLHNRIGDLIAIPSGDAYLWWPSKQNVMQGRHGGLHPDEMLVPLFSLSVK